MSELAEKNIEESVPEVDPAIESEARALGWVPEEDFRGDKSKWRSAEEFVERGREILPILKKNKEELLYKNAALEAEISEMKATFEEFKEYRKADKERMYKQAMQDLKAKKKEAIENGDAELVVELDDAIDELKDSNRNTPKETAPEQSKIDPVMAKWISENDWYAKPALQVAANAAALEVQELFPALKGREFLDKVTEVVKDRYPDKFGVRRRNVNAVESSGENSGARSGRNKRSYENLPPDAKSACDRYVKQKLMTKEQFVEEYEWE